MAANYVIVANFFDWARPLLKFQKNRHIAARKLQFRFGSALKLAVFGFENRHSTRSQPLCPYRNKLHIHLKFTVLHITLRCASISGIFSSVIIFDFLFVLEPIKSVFKCMHLAAVLAISLPLY